MTCYRSSSKLFSVGPLLDKFPDDTYAIEGEGLLLPVSVRGSPRPSTTWYFEGIQLTQDNGVEIQQDGSIFISLIQLKHTGHYRFVAKNQIGSIEKSFNLYVKLRELKRMLTLQNGIALRPIPLEEFGKYVADNHAHDNKGFKNQYAVSFGTDMICMSANKWHIINLS